MNRHTPGTAGILPAPVCRGGRTAGKPAGSVVARLQTVSVVGEFTTSVQPPDSDLGTMVSDGRALVYSAWWKLPRSETE